MKNRESDGMTHKAVIEELSLLDQYDGALMGNHGCLATSDQFSAQIIFARSMLKQQY